MLRKNTPLFAVILFFFSPFTLRAMEDENLPPLIIFNDVGVFSGTDSQSNNTTKKINDRLENFLKKAELPFKSVQMPWARIILQTPTMNNALIMELIRTESRENYFHWLLPLELENSKISLYARGDLGLEGLSKAEIVKKPLTAICQKNSAQCGMLRTFGFPDSQIMELTKVNNGTIENLIIRGRADVTINYNYTFEDNKKILKIPEGTIVPIMALPGLKIYIAGSKGMHPEFVSRILKAKEKFWDPVF